MKTIPWQDIKTEYIAGDADVTQRALSVKYNVRPETICRRARKEEWDEARSIYRQQALNKTLNKASTREAEIRAKHLKLASTMRGAGLAGLEELVNEKRLRAVMAGDLTEIRLWLVASAEIERKAAGIADELEVGYDMDMSTLSDDELRAIVAGRGKGKAGA